MTEDQQSACRFGRVSKSRSKPRSSRLTSVLVLLLGLLAILHPVSAELNVDGGRSQLPGMKQDMFDRAQREKNNKGGARMGKGPPECPKSDKMSPFFGVAFVGSDLYVKLNSTEDQCSKLISIGSANLTVLSNASRTCGPAGEWKKRIVEDTSAVFFQAGLDWVKHENDTIEVATEDGTFQVPVNEIRYGEIAECWARGCDCEQAKNPMGRAVLVSLLAICLSGLLWDAGKLGKKKIWGEKPVKYVQCKNNHRMEEVKLCPRHMCDLCGAAGTTYACKSGCPYDLCKACYKDQKKKAKQALQEWYDKHPDDKLQDEAKKKTKKASGEKDGSDDDGDAKDSRAESEAESTSKADTRAESGKEDEADSKPDSDGQAESEVGATKAT